MANECKLITNFNHISAYGDRCETVVTDALTKGIMDIEARAKAKIVANGQVDTGAMLNSVQGVMVSPTRAECSVGVAYGAPQELGYKGIPGRPFLGPAFFETVPEVEAFLRIGLNAS